MDNYIFRVFYQKSNSMSSKDYSEMKSIQKDFKITREQIKNFYMNVRAVNHDTIRRIEKINIPIKKPRKIIISFD